MKLMGHGALNSKKIRFNYIINIIGKKVKKGTKSEKKNKSIVKDIYFRFQNRVCQNVSK